MHAPFICLIVLHATLNSFICYACFHLMGWWGVARHGLMYFDPIHPSTNRDRETERQRDTESMPPSRQQPVRPPLLPAGNKILKNKGRREHMAR